MTATVQLNNGTAIAFDPVASKDSVLLSLEGDVTGQIMNCVLIPLDKIAAVMAMLQLVANQVKP